MKTTLYTIATTIALGCSTPTLYTIQDNQHHAIKSSRAPTPPVRQVTPEQRCLEEIFASYHPEKGDANINREVCQGIKSIYQQGIDHVTRSLEQNYHLHKDITSASNSLIETADLAQKTALLITLTQEQAKQYAIMYPDSEFKYLEQLDGVKDIATVLIATSKNAAQTIVANHALYTELREAYRTGNLKQPLVESIDAKIKKSSDALKVLRTNEQTTKQLAETVIIYKKALDKDIQLRQRNGGILPGQML